MNKSANILPLALALITVTVWGLTFISTKVLLDSFSPIEILFLRFALGFIALCFVRPHILHVTEKKHHVLFFAAGLCGVCLYFLLENIALQFCTASNISVTVATAPMFTAIVARVFRKKNALNRYFVAGFILAIFGIILTSFADVSTASVGLGDVLAVGAALTWAFYSNIIDRLQELGYESIAVTKRCFACGLVFIAVLLPVFGTTPSFILNMAQPVNALNMTFLGFGASAACFSMWAFAVAKLGVARTSAFIYLSPGVTVLAGVIILGEPFTFQVLTGLVLVLGGLALSQRTPKKKLKRFEL